MTAINILTLNAGSSSIKYKAFQIKKNFIEPLLSGLIEGISESEGLWHHSPLKTQKSHSFQNHKEAFQALVEQLNHNLKNHPIDGVGHRVVHGGSAYHQPTIITAQVLEKIKQLAKLAPIHNPLNALGIELAQNYYPNATHIAIFDTGFHHTLPTYVAHYAIKTEITNHYQIRKYGFHGINHEYVAQQAAEYLKKPLSSCNFINLHLGNGASACLIKEGKSFDTTMGMTPLAGLIMGTRCGDIDPAIPLYLQQQGMNLKQVDWLLNQQSGLKGIAAENDMRKLLIRANQEDESARLALDMYVYTIQKTIGAYMSQVNTLDALIFTGGIGENAALIRERIMTSLSHFNFLLDKELNLQKNKPNCHTIATKGIPILVIQGNEEVLIAQKVAAFLNGS